MFCRQYYALLIVFGTASVVMIQDPRSQRPEPRPMIPSFWIPDSRSQSPDPRLQVQDIWSQTGHQPPIVPPSPSVIPAIESLPPSPSHLIQATGPGPIKKRPYDRRSDGHRPTGRHIGEILLISFSRRRKKILNIFTGP